MSESLESLPCKDVEMPGSVAVCPAEMVEQSNEDSLYDDRQFYCEQCLKFYLGQCEVHGPPVFTHDSPTPVGMPQRALLTLPSGLVIGRSSTPGAGLGVFNQGQVVPAGMHFGAYDGDVTSREKALESAYSWVVCRGKEQYEYIDAERDTHSNWMRYVVCSRNVMEQNLVAFQQSGRVLFRCCRPILPGQELKVWYAEEYAKGLGITWDQLWDRKCTLTGRSPEESSPVFPCPYCKYSFPAEAYLQRHIRRTHPEEYQHYTETQPPESQNPVLITDMSQCPLPSDTQTAAPVQPVTNTCELSTLSKPGLQSENSHNSHLHNHTDSLQTCTNGFSSTESQQADCFKEASSEAMHRCDICGRRFVRLCHLKRHQRTIHSKEKPYCCSQCKRCFSQATGLKRHQQTHQVEEDSRMDGEEAAGKDPVCFDVFPCNKCSFSFVTELNLHKHIKRHHYEEYLRLVENGSVSAETLLHNSKTSDKLDPPYEPPTNVRLSAPNPLQNRPKRGCVGRPRGRPPSKTKQRVGQKLVPESSQEDVLSSGAECDERLPNTKMQEAPQRTDADPDADTGDPPTPPHICGECQRSFSELEALKAHECIQVGESPHGCSRCSLYFNRLCNLRRHERTIHSKERPYCCTLCFKSFTQSSSLKRHQQSHVRRKARRQCAALADATIFPCPHCPFSFTGERYLHKHIRRHHPLECIKALSTEDPLGDDQLHNCTRCSKSFRSLKGFKSHSCVQHGEKVYLCPDCGKGFSWFNSLKQHQRIHTGEKPFSCPQCEKSFVHSGQLNVHLRTHTGEKPFLCAECGESFRQSGDLKRHERKHTGVRPCQCLECGKSFSRPQSLRAHQQLHSGKKLYSCAQCGKSFTRRYHLNRHHQKMHS